MKKLIVIFIAFLGMIFSCYPQTKFMGIPVDGTREEVRKKLENRGFEFLTKDDHNDDLLTGDFNGHPGVLIIVQTMRGKVFRIGVAYSGYSETQIKIEFNNLLKQFESNNKYLSLDGNRYLTQDDNIYSLMEIKKVQINSIFYQKPYDPNNIVWFCIFKQGYDSYGIVIYYENGYNKFVENTDI